MITNVVFLLLFSWLMLNFGIFAILRLDGARTLLNEQKSKLRDALAGRRLGKPSSALPSIVIAARFEARNETGG
jgi:hypothetical protein